jgi:hypothetical protein
MTDAMRAVWGVPVTPDDVWATHPAGRTDREIARLVLRGAALRAALENGLARLPSPAGRFARSTASRRPPA